MFYGTKLRRICGRCHAVVPTGRHYRQAFPPKLGGENERTDRSMLPALFVWLRRDGYPCCLAEYETDRLEELDGKEVDDDEGGAVGDARAEGVEDVSQAAQTARYKAEGDGDEAHAKGDDRQEATAEGRREEVARGGEEDGVGRQREQGQDDEVDDEEDEGDAESKTITER